MEHDELGSTSSQHEDILSIKRLELEVEQLKQARTEPIAVIGIGCRFPGGSNSPEAFWQLLAEGRDFIEEWPPERYEIDEFFDADVQKPGKTVSRWGSFVHDMDQFDAAFFGISPREAMFIDPQHRILLEVTWEALQRAGLPPEKLEGSTTGVFMGLFSKDYSDSFTETMVYDQCASANAHMGPGAIIQSLAAGRISYLLGLHGPSMVVDTACSSSLVAVHLACQSLLMDECKIALAGAVDLSTYPKDNLVASKMGILSPTGRCRTFDANADGFVRGEGCGVFVLKRHSQALADGDPVLALIRGSAVAHDGRSKGLSMLAPNGKSQEAVLRKALQNAGVAPEQISYVETHGSGTKVGDPIEFEALKAVVGQAHSEGSICMLGSVKTNIGHLFAAAGMAGLVKTVMSMRHQAIPPHLHLKTLNPQINFEHTPFAIPKHLSPWPVSAGPCFAGVSAAGLSGTNVHVVLEEVPASRIDKVQPPTSQIAGEIWLLPLSAKNTDVLRQLARTWCTELRSPGPLSNAPFHHICYTASLRRTHYQQRLALVAASHGDLTLQLQAFLQKKIVPGMSRGSALSSELSTRPVFIFSGQGAQWAGMGQDLFKRENVFRTALEKCDSLLRKYVPWSLLAELQADEAQSRLHETAIAQAGIVSVQIALSELWRSWGIEPAAVVGHSVGEITAAYVAGALDLEDAIRIVAHRGKLMEEAHGLGYMVAVEISETQAREYLADYTDKVAIAAVNSPVSVVLSGETTALDEILEKLLHSGIVARKLNVESAFHSPQMERLRIPVEESLKHIKARPGTILLLSTVTGEPGSGEDCDAAYWGSNMCQPVLFSRAIENLLNMGYSTFLEISPHPVLARSVKQSFARHTERSGLQVLSSLRRRVSERTTMLTTLGSLYAIGYKVNWEQVFLQASAETPQVVPLPTYPWQHKRFWYTDKKPFSQQVSVSASPSSRLTGHPLLARRVRSAMSRDVIYETTVSTKIYPWLADHQASGMTVFPASGFIEMMHGSVRLAVNSEIVRLRDFHIHHALILLPGKDRVVQLVLQPTSDNPTDKILILSRPESDDSDEWTLHASGYYLPDRQPAVAGVATTLADYVDLEVIRQRCSEQTLGWEHYQLMQASGLAHGPAFQGVENIWWRQGEALGQLSLPQQLASEQGSYFMHPALLDACIHTAVGTIATDGQSSLYLPLRMDGVFFYQRPGKKVWVHITEMKSDFKQGLAVAQVHILSERGEPVALIDGLHLQRASQSALAKQRPSPNALQHWLYKVQWDLKAHQGALNQDGAVISSAASPRSWLLFCDKNGAGTQLAKDLRERGEQCFLIFADQLYQNLINESDHHTLNPSNPEHFQKFLEECMPMLKYPRCSIVFLWAMDALASAEETLEHLLQEQERLCGGLLHLVQAVVQRHWATSSPQLWVITKNSQDVSEISTAWAANASSVVQAPLWGLGRVIALEHPDLHCRLVDLPDHKSWERERFIEELLHPEPEDQIALRKGGRYTARLAVAQSDIAFQKKKKQQLATSQDDHETLQFSASGTYLITGGLGGLGMAVAQWMVEQRGVRHLVLTGRSPPTPEVLLTLSQLKRHGAQILVVQADVSDQHQVAELLETIQQVGLPLRGIVHAAGVLDEGIIMQMNWARFVKGFKSKMQGSWNLHLLTRDIPLDFIALFSSIVSFVAAPGQANYAAANAFMDGLAHYRRSLGLPAVSINWSGWDDLGMTKDAKSFERRLEREGVQKTSLEEGLAVFEQVLLDNPIQIAVFPINWSKASSREDIRCSPFVSTVLADQLLQQSKRQATISDRATADEAQEIKEPYAARFHERPHTLLEDVSRHLKNVLGLDPTSEFEDGCDLFDVGVDSFMAVDLRNVLQKETSLNLPANLVFEYPTIEAIAAYLASQLPPASDLISRSVLTGKS